MFKNVASQTVTVYAVDVSTGLPKSGDAPNITVYVSKDDGAVTALGDTTATEADAANAKGDYLFDLTQAETNADKLRFTGKSTTTNVVIVPQTVYTRPNRFSSLVIDSAGLADANAVKVGPSGSGAAQTARDLGNALPSAAPGASGGLLISGSNSGTTTLGALTVTGTLNVSDGISVTRSTSNSSAVVATGSGTGHGMILTSGSGATGNGLTLLAASTNGHGLKSTGTGTGDGAELTAGASGADLDADIAGNLSGSVGSVTGNVAGSVGSVASGGIASSSFAAGAIDAAAVATDAVGSAELAASAVAEIAAAVWDLSTAGHTTSGTFGAAVNAAGSAGDPWATNLPGSYGSGTAGYIVGNRLDAAVTSRSSHTAADVWAVGTRVLTAGTNIVLAKGTGVTGFNDLSAAQVNAEADTAIADVGLTSAVTGRIDAAVSTRMAAFTLPTNFSSLGITAGGKISGVVLVDTTTTNTDMRGTDNAALAATALSTAVWTGAKAAFLDAAVSTRSTLTAAGVWDLATSGHTTSGTFGAALVAASGGAGGGTTITTGDIDAIAAATYALFGSGRLVVTSPLTQAGRRLDLFRGDGYLASDGGTLIEWADDGTGWPDLATAVEVRVEDGPTLPASVIVATGAGKRVRAEPTGADTALLSTRPANFAVVATLASGEERTLVAGVVQGH